MLRPVIAVVGPTATGKSRLALDLAAILGRAQVVNADAMQLYRGMDIGTAKVPAWERRGVPHHQIDVLDPSEDASVAVYQGHARRDVEAILDAGDWAIVVGGSGLYVRALLDELAFPGTDPTIRAALEERAAVEGGTVLHRELADVDPAAAASIDPRNIRRVVRALEVVALAGSFSATLPAGIYHRPTVQLGLRLGPAELDARIRARTERMLADGLVDEVAGLGVLSRTAARATGYAQVLEYLAGHADLAETAEEIALATRQLARRQVKWFRRDARITWLDAVETSVLPAALGRLGEWLD